MSAARPAVKIIEPSTGPGVLAALSVSQADPSESGKRDIEGADEGQTDNEIIASSSPRKLWMALMVFVELSGLTTNQAQRPMHKREPSVVNSLSAERRCLFASVVSLMFHNGLLFKKTWT
ncbi:MAG: hypothetical protein ACLUD2_03130 [Clostridium sp.]